MSISTEGMHIPQWDIADRMRKSLRDADIPVQDMADYLEVSRNTVSAWINGRTPPSRQTIRLWALRTAVPYAWLKDGTTSAPSLTRTDDLRISSQPDRPFWSDERRKAWAHVILANRQTLPDMAVTHA